MVEIIQHGSAPLRMAHHGYGLSFEMSSNVCTGLLFVGLPPKMALSNYPAPVDMNSTGSTAATSNKPKQETDQAEQR